MLHVKSAMGILHDQTPWDGVQNTFVSPCRAIHRCDKANSACSGAVFLNGCFILAGMFALTCSILSRTSSFGVSLCSSRRLPEYIAACQHRGDAMHPPHALSLQWIEIAVKHKLAHPKSASG